MELQEEYPEEAQEELAAEERTAAYQADPSERFSHHPQLPNLPQGPAAGEQEDRKEGKQRAGVADYSAGLVKGVVWCTHSCQSILFLIAHSRLVSCAVMLIILWKLLTPAAQEGAWATLRGLPILGAGFDFTWQALDYWDALIKVKFTYAHMPGTLRYLWENSPDREAIWKYGGTLSSVAAALR